jgi:hypothetical protein
MISTLALQSANKSNQRPARRSHNVRRVEMNGVLFLEKFAAPFASNLSHFALIVGRGNVHSSRMESRATTG